MENFDFPILEFDSTYETISELKYRTKIDLPERMLGCFQQSIIDKLVQDGHLELIHSVKSNMGRHPIYKMDAFGQTIGVFQPGLGAPLSVAFLEEIACHGPNKFVIWGTCGSLKANFGPRTLVVPDSAIRDEGTSYHYLPPSREVEPSARVVTAIKEVLDKHTQSYHVGKTWTTDAIFRETATKIGRRRDEGCIVVDMEASALFAASIFRGIEIGMMFSTTDNVSGEHLEPCDDPTKVCSFEQAFWYAAEACASL